MKKAVITGCHGQDGQLMYELLSRKGYSLIGIGRTTTMSNIKRFCRHIHITKSEQVDYLIETFKPDEVYHLAAFIALLKKGIWMII